MSEYTPTWRLSTALWLALGGIWCLLAGIWLERGEYGIFLVCAVFGAALLMSVWAESSVP